MTKKDYYVNIQFKQLGLSKLSGEVAKLQTELPHLQKTLNALGSNNNLYKSFERSFGGIEKNIAALADLKKKIRGLGSDDKDIHSDSVSSLKYLGKAPATPKNIYKAVALEVNDLSTKILKARANFLALEQASTGMFTTLDKSTKNYILTLKEMGLSQKAIIALEEKQSLTLNTAKGEGNVKKLSAYNAELKTRLRLLAEANKKEAFLNASNLPQSIKGSSLDRLKTIKNQLNSLNKPLSEIQNKMNQLVPVSAVKRVEKLRNAFNDYAIGFRKLGLTSPTITKMRKDFDAIAKSFLKSGNSTELDAFNTSLKQRENILSNIVKLRDNVITASTTEAEKEKALLAIDEARLAAENGKSTGKQLNIKYEEAKQAVSTLNTELKNKAKIEADSLKLLQKYEQEYSSLKRLSEVKSLWASPESKKEAKEALAELSQMIKKVKELRASANSAKGALEIGTPVGLAKYEKEIAALKGSLNGVITKSREAKASLSNMGLAQVAKRTLAYASAYAGYYQLISAIRGGVGYVVELNKNMHVMAAVFDVNIEKAKRLQKGLVALGRTYGGEISSIDEAALALGRAGLAADDVVKATEIVIKMAKLTGDTIGVSSNALITYKQDFEDAAHPIGVLGDQLAYVANQSRLSTQDIGTFSNYALASAKAAGLSVEAINAMAISLSNAGVNASTIGTEIRRFSFLLRDSSGVVQKYFTALGTSQETFAARLRYSTKEANSAIIDLISKSAKLSNAAFSKSLKGMDIRAAEILTLLRNNNKQFLSHFKDLLNGVNGELDKSNYIAESYLSTWERVKNSMGGAFEALTKSGFGAANDQLQKLNDIFIKIGNNADKFIAKIIHYGKIIGGMLGSLVLFKSVSSIFGTILPDLKNMKTLLQAGEISLGASKGLLGGIFAILKKVAIVVAGFLVDNPIGVTIAAVAAVAYFAYKALNDEDKITTHIKKENYEIIKQQQLSSALHRAKIEKAKQELALTKAIRYGDIEKQKSISNNIVAIDLTITKLLGEKIVNDKIVKSIEKQNTLLGIQAKIKILQSERKQLININTAPAKERIKEIARELTKLNKAAKIKLVIITKDNVAANIALTKKNIERFKNNSNLPEKTRNFLVAQYTKNLVKLEAQQKKVIKSTKILHQTGEQKALFTVSKKDLDNFSSLDKQISKLYKIGANIDTIKATTEKILTNAATQYSKTVSTILINSLSKLPEGEAAALSKFPESIRKQIAKIKKDSKSLHSLQEIASFNAEVLQLKTNLSQTDVGDKGLSNLLSSIVDGAQEGATKIQNLKSLLKQVQAVGKVDKNKLSFIPYSGTVGGISALKDIQALQNTLIEKQKQLTALRNNEQITLNTVAVLKGKINDKSEKQVTLNNVLVTLYEKRKKLLTELHNLDGKGTITKKNKVEIDLKNTDTEINKIQKNILSTTKDILKLKGKVVDSDLKDADAIKKVNAETKAMYDKLNSGNNKNNYATHAQSLKKELGIVNFSPNMDKKKADAYFANMGATIETGKQTLANKQRDAALSNQDGGSVAPNQSIGGYNDILSNVTSDGTKKEASKVNLLIEQQQVLQQQQQAGELTMSEMHSGYMALEEEKERVHAQTMIDIDKKRFNATVGIYGAGASSIASTLDNLHKAGIIKSKGAFRAMQALQITAAIASTYLAVTQALANPPGPPWSYVNAAAALTAGMANVATIKAQKFHTGGYVGGQYSGQMGGLRDNEIPAILQKNEYVLTNKDVKAIKSGNHNNSSAQVAAPAPVKNETVIINSIDPAVIEDWATSRSGKEVIRNIVNV